MKLPPERSPLRVAAAAAVCLVGGLLGEPVQVLAYTVLALPILLALTAGWIVHALPFLSRWAFFFFYLVGITLLRGFEVSLAGYAALVCVTAIPAILAGALAVRGRR